MSVPFNKRFPDNSVFPLTNSLPPIETSPPAITLELKEASPTETVNPAPAVNNPDVVMVFSVSI